MRCIDCIASSAGEYEIRPYDSVIFIVLLRTTMVIRIKNDRLEVFGGHSGPRITFSGNISFSTVGVL